MLDTPIELREKHFVAGVKAEFEAEGTRFEEALRRSAQNGSVERGCM